MSSQEKARDFVISRVFDAPRRLLWRAWTEPAHLAQWMSPAGFSNFHAELDLRPGGSYLYGLKMPDGSEMWGKWLIREIVENERLVYVQHFSDRNGGVTRHPFSPEWPEKILSVITLADQGTQTLLTIRWAPLDASDGEIRVFNEGHASMNGGWGGTLEKLATCLAKQQA